MTRVHGPLAFTLLLAMLVVAVTSRAAPLSTVLDTMGQRIRALQSQLYEDSKRSCEGFPCMYAHLGAKAGRQALMRTLMSIIDDCTVDPSCSPGRRKRRRASSSAEKSSETAASIRLQQ